MPANLSVEMDGLGAGLEDQRALQIALELTKLGLNENDSSASASSPSSNQASFDSESQAAMMKKSANMTECVPVPSSEHVAEIVGRQGCKIKALRAKTNTYIKTPVRGEEPVFVVTGRKEDVCAAKHEILSAAEHFSQIRASRRNNNTAVPGAVPGPTTATLPGQVTIQVRVPYRVVGLVVGPKGATIKRIQQQTHTYIVTPNRDKEPIFEVTGMPDNVDKARQEIEAHIALRTGGIVEGNINNHLNNLHNSMGGSMANLNLMRSGGGSGKGSQGQLDEPHTDFLANGIDAGFHEISNNMLFSSMYNKSQNMTTSAFTPYNKALTNNQSNNMLSQHMGSSGAVPPRNHDPQSSSQMFTMPPPLDSMAASKFEGTNTQGGIYDSDEGIGSSPTFDSAALQLASASIWSDLHSESQGSAEFSTLFSSMNSTSSSSSQPSQSVVMSSVGSSGLSLAQLSFNGGMVPGSLGGSEVAPQHYQSSVVRSGESCLPMDAVSNPSSRRHHDSLAATLALLQGGRPGSNMAATTAQSEGSTSVGSTMSSSTPSSVHSGSASASPTEPTPRPLIPPPSAPRHCLVCSNGPTVAALVPCGHNAFCMDCAKQLVQDSNKRCPVCKQIPTQAIRIFS